MSYSLLYSLPQPLRYSNIPVSVEAGQLLRVTESGQLAAQLRRGCAFTLLRVALL